MKRIPAARQTASVPPTVVAPTAPCTTAAARSRGPTLRADGVEPLQLGLGEADDDLAVEHADRRRHRPAVAYAPARTRARPRRPRPAGSRARRASSRARRRRAARAAPRATSSPTRSRHRPELARSSAPLPRARAPTRRRGSPAANASPAPVVSTTRSATRGMRRRRRPRTPCAPRFTTQRVAELAERLRSRSVANTRSGASSRSRSRNRSSTSVHDERSTETRAPRRTGRARSRSAAARDRLAQQRVAGDVQHVAIEPGRVELVAAELGRDAAVGRHRPVAAGCDRHDDAGRPPAQARRPRRRAPRSSRATSSPAASSPRSPTNRASAPSAAAQAATFAACPPATDVRDSAMRSSPGTSGPSRAARSRRGAGRRGLSSRTGYDGRMDGGGALRRTQASLLRARRARRRGRGDRRRRRRLGRSRRPRNAPAGLAAFEDAPCFLEVVERRGAALPRRWRRDHERPVELE